MRNWKLKIAGIVVLGPILWFAASALTDRRTAEEIRYDQLLGARRSEGRFMSWRMKPWYATLSKLTRLDPIGFYRKKADGLEESLLKSGALVGVTFYRPPGSASITITNLVRLTDLRTGSVVTPTGLFYTAPGSPYVKIGSSGDTTSVVCRPRDVGYWQSTFCCITNRVSWGKLRKLGGNREEIMCILPDGKTVELSDCQKWLNESIASGWMVGVCASNRFLIALRRKPGG